MNKNSAHIFNPILMMLDVMRIIRFVIMTIQSFIKSVRTVVVAHILSIAHQNSVSTSLAISHLTVCSCTHALLGKTHTIMMAHHQSTSLSTLLLTQQL